MGELGGQSLEGREIVRTGFFFRSGWRCLSLTAGHSGAQELPFSIWTHSMGMVVSSHAAWTTQDWGLAISGKERSDHLGQRIIHTRHGRAQYMVCLWAPLAVLSMLPSKVPHFKTSASHMPSLWHKYHS